MRRMRFHHAGLPWLVSIAVVLLMLCGCGDSAQRQMQRAQIALANGKYETAVVLADEALARQPDDVAVLVIKADAQKRLLKLEAAKATLDRALAVQKDSLAVRRQLVSWVMVKLGNLLSQSDLLQNPQRENEFDQTLALGDEQVRFLREHSSLSAESSFIQARLALADVERMRLKQDALRKSLAHRQTPATSPEPLDASAMETPIARRVEQAVQCFQAVIQTDALYPEAAERYALLLRENRNWPRLWELSQRMVQEKTLAPSLVATLVQSLLVMPASVQPMEQVLQTSGLLLQRVEPDKRKSVSWRLTDARVMLVKNEIDRAIPVLETIVHDEPKNPTAAFLLAQCYFAKKDFQKAKNLLQDMVTQIRSGEVQSLYGRTLMELGDSLLAREALRAAIDINPDDAVARQAFLTLQAKTNHLDQMQSDVEEYYRQNPADPKAIRFKYQFELVRNNRQAIDALLEKVRGLDPLSDEHLLILCDGELFLQRYEKAQAWAEELVRRHPQTLENHLRLAQTMLMRGQDEQVRQNLQELRRQFPDSAGVDQLLAELYLQRGAYDRALELLEPVVEKESQNDAARLLMVRTLAGLNLFDQALTNLKILMEKNPKDVNCHMLAARLYQSMGRMEQANEHLSQIDGSKLDERTQPVLLAQMKARSGQWDQALDIAQRALAAGNADPALRQLMAGIHLQKKQIPQAEANLLSLVRSQPNNAESWGVLARFYVEQKMTDKGMLELVNLQALNEPLSRLAQSTLLTAAGKLDDARRMLQPILMPLVKQRHVLALAVADHLSRIDQLRQQPALAVSDYDPLIQAGFMADSAMLRQIDLTSSTDGQELHLQKLDELAVSLAPDQKGTRFELIRRYASLKKFDRALALVAQWQAMQPDQASLVRLEADLFRQADRPEQALQTIALGIERFPDDVVLRRQLAVASLSMNRFPQAQQAFLDLAQIDPAWRISAMADLGQMFVALGLNRQATEVFDRLEKESHLDDPRLMLAMGKAYAAMKMNEPALKRLLEVPEYAKVYAAAQIQAAQIEQAIGQAESARQRLEKLSSNPEHSSLATVQLIQMDLRNRQAKELIRWSDRTLAIDSLPENLRRSWMSIRLAMADAQRDRRQMEQTIEAFAKAYPASPQVGAAKVLWLAMNRSEEEAKQAYRQWPGLADSPLGVLTAVAVNEMPTDSSQARGTLDSLIAVMATGDRQRSLQAVSSLSPQQMIFVSDLKSSLEQPGMNQPSQMASASRQLAMALLALRVNLPQTAYDIAQNLLVSVPQLAPAYAIQTQTLIEMEQPDDPVAERLLKTIPDSSIALLVQARRQASAGQYDQSIALLEKLLRRDPDHPAVSYYLTQQLNHARRYDQAIALLESLHRRGGSFQVQVANDLAYLLAEHQPKRLDEAAALAGQAYEQSRRNPAILDTIGWIGLIRGESKAALEHLSQAIIPLNQVAEVHYHIAMAYEKQGHRAWARHHLQQAADSPDERIAARARDAIKTLE